MRGDGYLNDNVLSALLYQKYQEYVLGKPAIILWNETDPDESNGWHGINVWVAEDSTKLQLERNRPDLVEEPMEHCSACGEKTEGLYNFEGDYLYCKGCLS